VPWQYYSLLENSGNEGIGSVMSGKGIERSEGATEGIEGIGNGIEIENVNETVIWPTLFII